jgi:hypothetical protein
MPEENDPAERKKQLRNTLRRMAAANPGMAGSDPLLPPVRASSPQRKEDSSPSVSEEHMLQMDSWRRIRGILDSLGALGFFLFMYLGLIWVYWSGLSPVPGYVIAPLVLMLTVLLYFLLPDMVHNLGFYLGWNWLSDVVRPWRAMRTAATRIRFRCLSCGGIEGPWATHEIDPDPFHSACVRCGAQGRFEDCE